MKNERLPVKDSLLPDLFKKPLSRAAFLGRRLHDDPEFAQKLFHDALMFSRIAVAGGLLADGLKFSWDFIKYPITDNPVTFIAGAHTIPDEWPLRGFSASEEQVSKMAASGDTEASSWPQDIVDTINDRRKEAKKHGRNEHVLGIDSGFYIPNRDQYPWYPHPPAHDNKEEYPEHLIILGAETFDNFLIDPIMIPGIEPNNVCSGIDELTLEVKNWYDTYADNNVQSAIDNGKNQIAGILLQGLVAQGIVAPTLLESTSRRKVIIEGILLALMAYQAIGKLEIFGNIAGLAGNLNAQKVFTDMQSSTDEIFGSDRVRLWLLARTAWAIEKADYYSQQHNNIPVDLLYGDCHTDQVPSLILNREFRLKIIEEFMSQHAIALKRTILEKPPLVPYLEKLMYYSLAGMSICSEFELNDFWGLNKIPDDFSCYKDHTYKKFYVPSLYSLATKVLKQEGISVDPALEVDRLKYLLN